MTSSGAADSTVEQGITVWDHSCIEATPGSRGSHHEPAALVREANRAEQQWLLHMYSLGSMNNGGQTEGGTEVCGHACWRPLKKSGWRAIFFYSGSNKSLLLKQNFVHPQRLLDWACTMLLGQIFEESTQLLFPKNKREEKNGWAKIINTSSKHLNM